MQFDSICQLDSLLISSLDLSQYLCSLFTVSSYFLLLMRKSCAFGPPSSTLPTFSNPLPHSNSRSRVAEVQALRSAPESSSSSLSAKRKRLTFPPISVECFSGSTAALSAESFCSPQSPTFPISSAPALNPRFENALPVCLIVAVASTNLLSPGQSSDEQSAFSFAQENMATPRPRFPHSFVGHAPQPVLPVADQAPFSRLCL